MIKTFLQFPTKAEMIFGLRCVIAASIALYVALKIGLPRPFWAPMATCIVSQGFSGSTTIRAYCRLIGTFFGVIFASMVLMSFINYTFIFSLLMGLWVGGCMYLSMLKRTTDAYSYNVAGFTVPVIVCSIISDANTINIQFVMDTIIARVEETGIGFVSAMLAHTLFFPNHVGSSVLSQLDGVTNNIRKWAQSVLMGETEQNNDTGVATSRVLIDMRVLTANFNMDGAIEKWASHYIRIHEDRLTMMVPLVSSIGESIHQLNVSNAISPSMRHLLDDIATFVSKPKTTLQEADNLHNRIKDIMPVASQTATWEENQIIHLCINLEKLVSACESIEANRNVIMQCLAGSVPIHNKEKPEALRPLYQDKKLALLVSLMAVVTMTTIFLLWVASGWPAGFVAPTMASIFTISFIKGENSVAALKTILLFTIYSIIPAGYYLLVVMFSAHSYEMLMMCFAPAIFMMGIFMTRPKIRLGATIFMMGIWSTTTMYDLDMANATSFMNGQVFAQCAGITFGLLTALVFRSFDFEWTTKRLMKAVRKDISALSLANRAPSVMRTTVDMVDRINIIVPRLGDKNSQRESTVAFLFREIRIALNMVYLMHMKTRLLRNGVVIEPVLNALSQHFSEKNTMSDEQLLAIIDKTLCEVCSMTSPIRKPAAVAALTGIRRDLFPEAHPYYPNTLISKELA